MLPIIGGAYKFMEETHASVATLEQIANNLDTDVGSLVAVQDSNVYESLSAIVSLILADDYFHGTVYPLFAGIELAVHYSYAKTKNCAGYQIMLNPEEESLLIYFSCELKEFYCADKDTYAKVKTLLFGRFSYFAVPQDSLLLTIKGSSSYEDTFTAAWMAVYGSGNEITVNCCKFGVVDYVVRAYVLNGKRYLECKPVNDLFKIKDIYNFTDTKITDYNRAAVLYCLLGNHKFHKGNLSTLTNWWVQILSILNRAYNQLRGTEVNNIKYLYTDVELQDRKLSAKFIPIDEHKAILITVHNSNQKSEQDSWALCSVNSLYCYGCYDGQFIEDIGDVLAYLQPQYRRVPSELQSDVFKYLNLSTRTKASTEQMVRLTVELVGKHLSDKELEELQQEVKRCHKLLCSTSE